MKDFGLIIQQTNTGLQNQYVSEHLDVREQEIAQTLTDERLLATQLANHSNVYCVQTTEHFKVFSLIVTNVTDVVGRAGFCAIRLYVSKYQNINVIQKLLFGIKDSYFSFKENNSLASQNYEQILSSILVVKDEAPEYLSTKNMADAVIYTDPASQLDLIFHNRKCHLFNKVYVFDKEKAADINIAIRQGMISFEKYVLKAKEIEILDTHTILKEIMVNDQKVSFNPDFSNFTLICLDNDIITYNTQEDQCFKTIHDSPHSILKKYVPPRMPSYGKKQTVSKKKFPGVFIITGLMIILLGAGIWYLFLQDGSSDTEFSQTITNEPLISNNEPIQSITFIQDSTTSDSVYKTNYPQLDKYRFKFKTDQWFFKNTKDMNNYRNFSAQMIVEILKQDSLDFSEGKKKEFANALQSISKHEVTEKAILKPDIADKLVQNNSTKTTIEKRGNIQQLPSKKIEKREPTTEKKINDAYN